MSDVCPTEGALVDIEQGRVLTQYREAKRFRAYLAAILGQVEEIARVTCAIPSYFDILTAVGEQLTFIGERMGFPRCHCVCDTTPVFGFADCVSATPITLPIVGFCEESTWLGCGGVGTLCIDDDEAYRAHLLARRYQMLGLFDIGSLTAALQHLWGSAAWVVEASRGRVVIGPGRDLTTDELQRLSVSLRILPIAPGIRLAIHFGDAPIFGFGEGWAGFCDTVPDDNPGHWLCPLDVDPAACL